MTALVVLAGIADVLLLAFTVWCLKQSRGPSASLRLRIFTALAVATLVGAFATGLYAVLSDGSTIGFQARLARVVPKAFVLSSMLLPLAAAAAAIAGKRLARSVEELADAATKIAGGERTANLPHGSGGEAQRLARALASMRRELEAKPYAAAFLRDAWHDLKTPVAALRATLEVLEDDADLDPNEARHFLGNMRRATDQLECRLLDLVTLARYETAALGPSNATSMSTVVTQAMARIEPLARAKSVSMGARARNPRMPALLARDRLRCDPAALARALDNLLENAVVATPGGAIQIAVDDTARDAVIVDIVNEPSSIPLDMRSRLFERAATSQRRGGSGLGLAIVRAAVEAHGGRIRFMEMGPPRVRVRIELPR